MIIRENALTLRNVNILLPKKKAVQRVQQVLSYQKENIQLKFMMKISMQRLKIQPIIPQLLFLRTYVIMHHHYTTWSDYRKEMRI